MPPLFATPLGSALVKVEVAAGVQFEDIFTIVEGVVSPRGQGGWPGDGQGYDVHCFAFSAWRLPGQSLVERELTLLRPVAPSQEGIFDDFPDYSIQRLRVLLSIDQMRAVIDKALTIDRPDEALLALAERLRKPVVISTDQFGDLVLNPTVGWFEGNRQWNGRLVKINFVKDDDTGVDGAIKTAVALWSDEAGWKRRVDDYAIKELLPLKNEGWLDEDEAELSYDEFKSRMSLQSITVEGSGRFDFWHNDGDLFWGHSIQIAGTLQQGCTDADIPG